MRCCSPSIKRELVLCTSSNPLAVILQLPWLIHRGGKMARCQRPFWLILRVDRGEQRAEPAKNLTAASESWLKD